MSTWRLLGELTQARTREELQANFSLEWNPWTKHWYQLQEPPIVVPDPQNPNHLRHAVLYETSTSIGRSRFAVAWVDDVQRIYVLAGSDEAGAFEALTPRYEGFWRTTDPGSQGKVSNPDWPIPEPRWVDREAFLASLDRVEQIADKTACRGYSPCRICGCRNGYLEFTLREWAWPAGFRHYVDEHHVRPSKEFQNFVSQYVS